MWSNKNVIRPKDFFRLSDSQYDIDLTCKFILNRINQNSLRNETIIKEIFRLHLMFALCERTFKTKKHVTLSIWSFSSDPAPIRSRFLSLIYLLCREYKAFTCSWCQVRCIQQEHQGKISMIASPESLKTRKKFLSIVPGDYCFYPERQSNLAGRREREPRWITKSTVKTVKKFYVILKLVMLTWSCTCMNIPKPV